MIFENLYEDEKNLIPYYGNEVLTFINVNTNDTHIFVGEPNWTTYYNSSYGGADCIIDYKREGRGIAYISPTYNSRIVLNQYISQTRTRYFEIQFNSLFVETRLLFSGLEKIKDSIVIQNKIYYDVYFYSNDETGTKPTNYGCYYTRTDGIIKLLFTTGETWELVKKQ